MDQRKFLDRHYGDKRLIDMTLDEVEQALRDVQNKIEQIERDAVNAVRNARIQSPEGLQDDDAEAVYYEHFLSHGGMNALVDVFLLEKILETFSKPPAFTREWQSLELLFYGRHCRRGVPENPPGVAKIFTERN
jgi:hypothetical protein